MILQSYKNWWYRFKCWGWKRYTTIKPRTLGHTWADMDTLMLHLMFELLCRFIENERPEEVSEWRGEYAVYLEDGTLVIDEILRLYNWWNVDYLKVYPVKLEKLESEASKLWKKSDPNCPGWREKITEIHAFEEKIKNTEMSMMKRLVDVSPYLWT